MSKIDNTQLKLSFNDGTRISDENEDFKIIELEDQGHSIIDKTYAEILEDKQVEQPLVIEIEDNLNRNNDDIEKLILDGELEICVNI